MALTGNNITGVGGASANSATALSPVTTARREWLGWFGAMFWLYSMINGYQYLPNSYNSAYYLTQDIDYIWWGVIAFLAVGVISITVAGLRFGRDPNGLGALAFYTAPVAVAFTAAFPYLPQPWGSVLYVLSPAFMAPALVRRAYGVVRTAGAGYALTAYMSGIAVAFATMNPFLDYCCDHGVPVGAAYAVYAAIAVPAWVGVRRAIAPVSHATDKARFAPSTRTLLLISAAGLLMFWFIKMKSNINYTVEQFDDMLYIPVYYVLAPISYVLFGLFGDKGRERVASSAAFAIFLVSMQLSFIARDPMSPALVPLVFANHFLGMCVEYFILAIPVYFFAMVERPVFASSFGVAAYLLCWIFTRSVHPFLPDALMRSGAPLFVSAATTATVLFFVLHSIFLRHRESTLAASIYALLHSEKRDGLSLSRFGGDTATAGDTPHESEQASAGLPVVDEPSASGVQTMEESGFTQDEIKVAMLLIEGKTRNEILRKLHISAAEVDRRESALRHKVLAAGAATVAVSDFAGDLDINAIVQRYGLTHREADILRCLYGGMTNAEIASELVLSKYTVKIHVHNLMQKLPTVSRQDITLWVDQHGDTKQ